VPKTSDKAANHSFPAMIALSKASEGTNSELCLATEYHCESLRNKISSYNGVEKSIMWRHQQIFIYLRLAWLHEEARNT